MGALLAVTAFSGACSDDGAPSEPECLSEPANLDCDALYGLNPDTGQITPTFTDLFNKTLKGTCGSLDSCHSSAGANGGLILDVEQTAYDRLLAKGTDGKPRVRPGDVRCGRVIVRLESVDEPWSMPPGQHLDEPTLCVIRHWIANGAPR
jgi:hypothetical protein